MTEQDQSGLAAIGARVNALDMDVKRLRIEFDDYRRKSEEADREASDVMKKMDAKLDQHVAQEDRQYREQERRHDEQGQKIEAVQASINTLSDELKEPLEIYRTAKYSVRATGAIASTLRSIWPIAAAVVIGVGAIQAKLLYDLRYSIEPQQTAQQQRPPAEKAGR